MSVHSSCGSSVATLTSCDFSVTRSYLFQHAFKPPENCHSREASVTHSDWARTRGKIVSVNGGKPGQQPGFHFLHAGISSISQAGSSTQATKGPTLFNCPFKRKRRSPDGGDGASSGSSGGNNVTGGKPSRVLT